MGAHRTRAEKINFIALFVLMLGCAIGFAFLVPKIKPEWLPWWGWSLVALGWVSFGVLFSSINVKRKRASPVWLGLACVCYLFFYFSVRQVFPGLDLVIPFISESHPHH